MELRDKIAAQMDEEV